MLNVAGSLCESVTVVEGNLSTKQFLGRLHDNFIMHSFMSCLKPYKDL